MPRIFAVLDNDFKGNKDFYLNYSYDNSKKQWVFLGYKCVKCERNLKHVNTTQKHLSSCRGKGKKNEPETIEANTVLDKHGNLWNPLEFNQ